jgi:hypothetical protein
MKQMASRALVPAFFMLISCLAYSLTPKTDVAFSSETPLIFKGLHDVISQKTELLIYESFYSL